MPFTISFIPHKHTASASRLRKRSTRPHRLRYAQSKQNHIITNTMLLCVFVYANSRMPHAYTNDLTAPHNSVCCHTLDRARSRVVVGTLTTLRKPTEQLPQRWPGNGFVRFSCGPFRIDHMLCSCSVPLRLRLNITPPARSGFHQTATAHQHFSVQIKVECKNRCTITKYGSHLLQFNVSFKLMKNIHSFP